MRLSAANPRLLNQGLKLIPRNLPKAATQSNPAANVPIPPESYRGLHLVSRDQEALANSAPPRLRRSISVLRDRVAAIAAALLLILAAT